MSKKPTQAPLLRRLLARAAVAAIALDPLAAGAAITAPYPEPLVIEALDEDTLSEWSSQDKTRILRAFARDPRASVRVAAACELRQLSVPLSRPGRALLVQLACDDSIDVQAAAARSLAGLLEAMPGLDRTHLVCKWSSSGRHRLELAVARALEHVVDVLGGDACIDHLARHRATDVRLAAGKAARVRWTTHPLRSEAILRRLQGDPDPAVAAFARETLAQA